MKYFISNELGVIYRYNKKNDVMEYVPILNTDNYVIDTDDFTDVELDLVGDEIVTLYGKEITIRQACAIVKKELTDKKDV